MQIKKSLKRILLLFLGLIFLILGLYLSVQFERAEKVAFERVLTEQGLGLNLERPSALTEYFKFFPLLIIAFGFVFLQMSYLAEKRAREVEEEISRALKKEIIEREQAEEELAKAHARLIQAEKLAAVSQIAAEAAHEIKNPLQVMKTGLYYLKQITNKEDVEVQQTIHQMDNAILRATGFINDLLNFSRPPQLNTAKIQINELISGAIKELPAEVLSDVEVTQNLSSGLPEISVDSDRLRQVIINLVKNAAEAMGEVRSKKLEVRSKKEGEFVKISISDTGKGIAKEDMGKVFDPFYTTRGKGIGLGLAICRRLVEAHQGEIEVESEVGVGTTFMVQLPIYITNFTNATNRHE